MQTASHSLTQEEVLQTGRSAVAAMSAILEPVLDLAKKHAGVPMAALPPIFVNIFIPLSAALGLVFAIWCGLLASNHRCCVRSLLGRVHAS